MFGCSRRVWQWGTERRRGHQNGGLKRVLELQSTEIKQKRGSFIEKIELRERRVKGRGYGKFRKKKRSKLGGR